MKFQLYSVLLFLTLFACSEGGEEVGTNEVETVSPTFVAEPQAVPEQVVETLTVGSPAPDFNLIGTDGKYYQLGSFADYELLVLIFTANHCPTAQAYEERIKAFAKDYAGKGVQLIAISPNSPLGLLYEELGYSDLNDDYADMKIRGRDANFDFPYLYDGDDHAASLQYGPVATPHAFVLDKERVLRYTGRLDRTEKPGTTNAEDLREAVDALLSGEAPSEPTTKTFGCSTKWAWKTATKTKVDQEWKEKTVSYESLDLAGVKTLIENQEGEKLRLINVWATWCGPCVIEYPEFVILQRMYGARDFEFMSLSADKASDGARVHKFLQEQHSALSNYHFVGGDKYDLIEAVDPAWNGALPYTLLIDPAGEVVWRHQGEVDFLELKRAIVDHPMIGRYF